MSLNEASGVAGEERPFEVDDESAPTGNRSPKWPRETKPRLTDVFAFVVATWSLARLMKWAVLAGSDDQTTFFNQFATRPAETWKTMALFERGGKPWWYVH